MRVIFRSFNASKGIAHKSPAHHTNPHNLGSDPKRLHVSVALGADFFGGRTNVIAARQYCQPYIDTKIRVSLIPTISHIRISLFLEPFEMNITLGLSFRFVKEMRYDLIAHRSIWSRRCCWVHLAHTLMLGFII